MNRILFLNLAAVAVSCVPVDGGAVEANWVVRSADGRAINDCGCTDPRIIFVRLNLLGVSPPAIKDTQPCKDRVECGFGCQSQTGTSRFDIPPGSYLMAVTPTDAVGYDLTTPGPDGARKVQRSVPPAPSLSRYSRGTA